MSDEDRNMPGFGKPSFTCPYCAVCSAHDWHKALTYQESHLARMSRKSDCAHFQSEDQRLKTIYLEDEGIVWQRPIRSLTYVFFATCQGCKNSSLWLGDSGTGPTGEMIHPVSCNHKPLPVEGVSKEIRDLYNEAASIAILSPCAAVAFLRVTIESLCRDLLKGKLRNAKNPDRISLSELCEMLATEYRFSENGRRALEVIRSRGNDAVHRPCEIDLNDHTKPDALFKLVRYIVSQCITQEKEVEEILALNETGGDEVSRPSSSGGSGEDKKPNADLQTGGT